MTMAQLLVAVIALFAFSSIGNAQYSGWPDNQINASMCLWKAPRAALVRDTVYIDGGDLLWIPGLKDGTFGYVTSDDNPLGLMYSYNFSQSFSLSQNLTALFAVTSKAPGAQHAANNIAPNYIDGAALANDDEVFFYGGLVRKTLAFPAPFAPEVWEYQANQYGTVRPSFTPGFIDAHLPDNITRYLAYGAVAAAPSEQLAWYISGMSSPSHGPIYRVLDDDALNAVNISNYLLTLHMPIQQQETWSNITLPSSARPRAAAQAVWLPVGSRGIVVVIGGITYPEFASASRDPGLLAAANSQSSEFMSTADVLDVTSGQWYRQSTVGAPSGRCRGCVIGTWSRDASSFNIYYYGGYSCTDSTENFFDQVWVLSLPSFSWTLLNSGITAHARAGHVCLRPYPDQMFVLGGYIPQTGVDLTCLDGGVIQLLNLTDGAWMSSYDPLVYSEYSVPAAVQSVIGGDHHGGATVTAPLPSGVWQSPALAQVFSTAYPTSKISAWYPYGNAQSTSSSISSTASPASTSISASGGGGSSGLPAWVAPVLGAVLGLMLVILLAVAFLLWKRRKVLMQSTRTSHPTDENGMTILNWMHGQDAKSPTAANSEGISGLQPSDTFSETDPASPAASETFRGSGGSSQRHEMENTGIAELMDTSPPVELQGDGLSHTDIISRFSRLSHGAARRAPNPSSMYSSLFETDGSSGTNDPLIRQASHGSSPSAIGPSTHGAGLPSPSHSTPSGVSRISGRDLAHLRQISAETVSSGNSPDESVAHSAYRAVSPPPAELESGQGWADYTIAGPPFPIRRSIFRESQEDMGHIP